MEKLAAATDSEPEVSADLLTELNAPDADDDRADRPEEEVTEGIEQAVASATERSKGSQHISQEEIVVLDRMAEIAGQARRLADPRLTDAKYGLIPWIRTNLFNSNGTWNSRRVLIFTEFTETKTYLRQQFESAFANTDLAEERIATYQGGPGGGRLDEIKKAFNASPDLHPLRILIATDAAREGVNFQNSGLEVYAAGGDRYGVGVLRSAAVPVRTTRRVRSRNRSSRPRLIPCWRSWETTRRRNRFWD
jgi:hypothetical protein